MIDQALFRSTMSRFATGVTVITTRHHGRDYGMTLSAMTSLCLEPPMLLICVNKAMPTHNAIRDSNRFVVNVLGEHQEELARQFSRPAADKFSGVDTTIGPMGLPILAGTLAHVECQVADRLTAGTHTIFVGSVQNARTFDEHQPLVYYGADFGRLLTHPRPPRTAAPAGTGGRRA